MRNSQVPGQWNIEHTEGVRLADISSTRYAIARRYMIRIRRDDFRDEAALAKLAATANLSPDEFRAQFEYLTKLEPPPLFVDEGGEHRN